MTTDSTVKAEALADFIQVSDRRVRQLAKEGVIPRASRGNYPFLPCVQAYITYLQRRAEGQRDESIDAQKEKARLLKHRADIAEMDSEERRGTLVDAEAVTALFAKLAGETKTRLLGVPTKVAPRVIGLTNMREVKQVIEEDIREALHELTSRRNGVLEGDDAAAEADPERVERQKPEVEPRGKRGAGGVED